MPSHDASVQMFQGNMWGPSWHMLTLLKAFYRGTPSFLHCDSAVSISALSCGRACSAYDQTDTNAAPARYAGPSVSSLFLKIGLKVPVCLWLLPSYYRQTVTLLYSISNGLCHALTVKTYNLLSLWFLSSFALWFCSCRSYWITFYWRVKQTQFTLLFSPS